jgi:hypothetical protein
MLARLAHVIYWTGCLFAALSLTVGWIGKLLFLLGGTVTPLFASLCAPRAACLTSFCTSRASFLTPFCAARTSFLTPFRTRLRRLSGRRGGRGGWRLGASI